MMKKTTKPAKGMIPAGMYADGGNVKPMPFKGKQDKAEEMAEAKAVKAGKVSPKQYMAREMAEEKAKRRVTKLAVENRRYPKDHKSEEKDDNDDEFIGKFRVIPI